MNPIQRKNKTVLGHKSFSEFLGEFYPRFWFTLLPSHSVCLLTANGQRKQIFSLGPQQPGPFDHQKEPLSSSIGTLWYLRRCQRLQVGGKWQWWKDERYQSREKRCANCVVRFWGGIETSSIFTTNPKIWITELPQITTRFFSQLAQKHLPSQVFVEGTTLNFQFSNCKPCVDFRSCSLFGWRVSATFGTILLGRFGVFLCDKWKMTNVLVALKGTRRRH